MRNQLHCNCEIQKGVAKGNVDIRITNAEKVQPIKTNSKGSSGSGGHYVYNIKTSCESIKEANRRYSEFASFRRSLIKLYPSLIIPPIPEKHSLTDYTYTTQMNMKDDTAVIEKRKRMLDRFLKRTAAHPILRNEHIFHRFIDGKETWTSISQSEPLSSLQKDPLLSVTEHSFTSSITNSLPSTSSLQSSNNVIPIPTSSYTLKYPDEAFDATEQKFGRATQQSTLHFDRSQRKIIKRLTDLSNDYAELGSVYNALSLHESSNTDIATSIEQMSQVLEEASHQSTKNMVQLLESEFSEHVQDYTQYLLMAKQVLKYRRMKQAQLELVEEAVVSKKTQLRNLTKTEEKSNQLKKMMMGTEENEGLIGEQDDENGNHDANSSTGLAIEEENSLSNNPKPTNHSKNSHFDTESIEEGFSAIVKASPSESTSTSTDTSSSNLANGYNGGEQNHHKNDYPTNASAPIMRASKSQSRKWSSPRKLLSAVTYTIQGMMDTDPEQTRRNQIQKLKDNIQQLEEAKVRLKEELEDMGQEIQSELECLQAQRETELRNMLIAFAKIHVSYCQQNCEAWERMRDKVKMAMEGIQ